MKKLKNPFKTSGLVIAGEKIGRTIGFPTANLKLRSQPKLKKGVYMAVCRLNNHAHLGLAYYGPRYIFNQKINSFEVYLFNFNQSIYGQKLQVKLIGYLRPPQSVSNLQALKKLLQKDIASLNNYVVLINRQDQPLAIEEKIKAHQGKAKLHRAVSVLIFNSQKKLLIQQRSERKMLFPLGWANTACTDVRPYETYYQAARRRLFEEFGLKAELKFNHQFFYKAEYRSNGSENELDSVFIGFTDQTPKPDKKEIKAWQYLSLPQLKKDLKLNPRKYTPWFKLILKKLKPSDILTS